MRSKLNSHSSEGVFVGNSETSKDYRILDPSTGKVTISGTVTFDEGIVTSQQFIDVSGTAQLDSTKHEKSEQFQETVDKTDEAKNIEIEIDEPSVSEQVPKEEHDDTPHPLRRSVKENRGIPAQRLSYVVQTQSEKEPESWKEMEKLPKAEKLKWIKAADEEMKSLRDLETW